MQFDRNESIDDCGPLQPKHHINLLSIADLVEIVLLWIICGPANGVWINQVVLYIGFSKIL